MSSSRRIIFQATHVRLILDEKDSATVFVTFNEMGFAWNGDQYWGQKLLSPLPVTVLGFVTPEPNWYPPEDMKGAIAAAVAAIAGRRVITYGHSQGGYGALKYSRALSASIALAFCPLWSINPDDVGSFDKRTAPYYKPFLKNGHRIEKSEMCARSFVFFDPREICDRKNAEKICEGSSAEAIVAPFGGHSVIAMVAESKIAGRIIDRGQRPDVTAGELRRIIQSGRRNSATYQREKLKRLLQRAKTGTIFLERHLAFYPDDSFKTIIEATVEFQRKNREIAVSMLRSLSRDEWLEHDLFALWRIFWEAQFSAGELIIAPLLKIKYPQDCFVRLHAINTYLRYRLTKQALSEMELLVELPDAHKQSHFLSDFYDRLGKPELRALVLRNAAAASARSRIRAA